MAGEVSEIALNRDRKTGGKGQDRLFRKRVRSFRSMKRKTSMPRASSNPDETRFIASDFVRNAQAGTVLSLIGDLGAGKTEFVKGLAAGLGFAGEVTSPTFTILHEYRGGRLPLFHMDFYRLHEESELDEIGFDEYLKAGGVCAIEWGDKFPNRLPPDSIKVVFSIEAGERREIVW
jgi:tRNA threonylcarbamoyladenosine biosynthesis protein TsaE